jgi:archaellum component FlaC
MAEEPNIVLEHLKAIRAQLDTHGERLNRIELRLGTVEQHLGLLVSSSAGDRDSMRALERRVERIERRLELVD